MLMAGTILFVRGADRSGGFLEATTDTQRTEQLADINNNSTASGNHGWGQLATLLRGEGYTVKQIAEPLERGAPSTGQTTGRAIAFEDLNLSGYSAIVMGSNNAVYSKASINALDTYVRHGGGVLFISDGNFGSSWADAPNSDNQFLSRYGLAFNQDNGQYALSRSAGDFVQPNAAVLIGVNTFDGEGVSPIHLNTSPGDIARTRIVAAKGTTYDNNPTSTANHSRGTARPVTSADGSLVLANVGAGRVAAFFDRNTFFNANGAGTDMTKNDNRQLATNLFNWVSDSTPPAIVSSSFAQGAPYVLKMRFDDNLAGTLDRSDIRLRNRKSGTNIPSKNWSFALSEGNGFTDVTIHIRSATPIGPYQLQVGRGEIEDDSYNVRTGAVRYNFTLLPLASTQRLQAFAPERATPALSSFESSDDLLDLLEG